MPKIRCEDCARYTWQSGCSLLQGHYFKFRDCMTEVKDYSFRREQPQGSSAMEQPVPEEVPEDDRR